MRIIRLDLESNKIVTARLHIYWSRSRLSAYPSATACLLWSVEPFDTHAQILAFCNYLLYFANLQQEYAVLTIPSVLFTVVRSISLTKGASASASFSNSTVSPTANRMTSQVAELWGLSMAPINSEPVRFHVQVRTVVSDAFVD